MSSNLVWAVWAGVAFLSFAVLELWGLRRPGGTLSETLRRLLGVDPRKRWRGIAIALFLGALVALGWHVLIG